MKRRSWMPQGCSDHRCVQRIIPEVANPSIALHLSELGLIFRKRKLGQLPFGLPLELLAEQAIAPEGFLRRDEVVSPCGREARASAHCPAHVRLIAESGF